MSLETVLIVFILLCLVAAIAVKSWENHERKNEEEGK